MLRRACASLVLAALVAQTSVSLYACHRFPVTMRSASPGPAHGPHAGHDAAGGVESVAMTPDGDSASMRGHVCNRHERGRCPHAHASTIGTCASDPVAGLQAASEAGFASPAAATLLVRPAVPLLVATATAPPGATARLPELPPPRV